MQIYLAHFIKKRLDTLKLACTICLFGKMALIKITFDSLLNHKVTIPCKLNLLLSKFHCYQQGLTVLPFLKCEKAFPVCELQCSKGYTKRAICKLNSIVALPRLTDGWWHKYFCRLDTKSRNELTCVSMRESQR